MFPTGDSVMIDEFPFGNPDGSHANLSDLLNQDFVHFDQSKYSSGISAESTDLTVRVLVGAKGSGKTAYLRRLHDGISRQENQSIYVDPDIGRSPPETDPVLRFCSLFDERILTEKWMTLWRCAILRSVLSHVLFSPRLRKQVDRTVLEAFDELRKLVGLSIGTPEPIYSSAKNILFSCRHSEEFTRFANQPAWDSITYYLAESIHHLPPCCFLLDSVDEEFGHAPMHWLRAQKGLFYAVMRLLRHDRLGGRLHVIIAIRDHVFSSVLRSEHQNRYRGEPHIKVLDWGWDSISHLLRTKIGRLSELLCMNPDMASGGELLRWLGKDQIENKSLGVTESLEAYLIRHTRQLPRDIVQLGNALAAIVVAAKMSGRKNIASQQIRDVVSKQAKSFGEEQLKICTNQILSSNLSNESTKYEFSDLYTGNVEYREDMYEQLRRVLRLLGKDSFSQNDLKEAEEAAMEKFGESSDAMSVLWQNRLLGYSDAPISQEQFSEVFYSEHNLSEFRLPRDKPRYLLHPCLIDSVGLTSVLKRPLLPGRGAQYGE
ncbi:hypothetical protein CGZ80_10660 [Rhodopirellula sp. MGV]|nr:hypothetical protein CGZ80_10660 [Rhodopirellula sp. MGV]